LQNRWTTPLCERPRPKMIDDSEKMQQEIKQKKQQGNKKEQKGNRVKHSMTSCRQGGRNHYANVLG